MKYKNIDNAIHNFGHAFMSLMNYFDDGHVVDDINALARKERDGSRINFSTGEIQPTSANTKRIKLSVANYKESVGSHLLRHNVNPEALTDIILHYRVTAGGGQTEMFAIDDRGVQHNVVVKRSL